ncbi:septum formation inhibitor Maf [Marinomonas sp. M1K-6]|uniref:dTTP/UTP pyrophosphatase n=1 Tax=Marinomonas profundi TaxID=2726122 RepID=A0A847R3I3_9GAMM|nr:Maf family protein [Marinomonas profundi]NLQ16943.1 septum formation inhibitor Maf [Marinomonas profundi]UDV02670.1 septum formation inhibitor Maf [Marinomonas profundi]
MLVLASASPRRKELLSLLVKEFLVLPADIDETPYENEGAKDYVIRMAVEKAKAATLIYQGQGHQDVSAVFMASDTSVVVDGHILGKPSSLDESKSMLRQLSGRSHQVLTSLCVCNQAYDHIATQCVISEVHFRSLSDVEITQYWKTGEPQDKAGSYAIQGVGSVFVESLVGSYSAVVGLPMFESAQLLAQFGIHPLEEKSYE